MLEGNIQETGFISSMTQPQIKVSEKYIRGISVTMAFFTREFEHGKM